MTKVNQKIWAVILAALMLVSVVGGMSITMNATRASAATSSTTTHPEANLVVQKAKDGNWYAFNKKTKKIATSYTGIAKNQYGWWRVYKGKVNFKANGVFSNSYGLWYVVNGKVDFDYNGTVTSNKKKYVIRSGKATPYDQYKFKTYDCNDLVVRKGADQVWYAFDGNDVAYDYTGIAPNKYGWWRIVDGKVDFNANGVFSNNNGTWYVKDGKVDFSYSGVTKYNGVTYVIVGGEAQVQATGTDTKKNTKYDSSKLVVKKGPDGQWYAYNGNKIASDYTGVAKNEYGWWVIENGKVNFSANGLYSNEYGTWYVTDGKVDFTFTGTAADALGVIYNVVNGKVQVSPVS